MSRKVKTFLVVLLAAAPLLYGLHRVVGPIQDSSGRWTANRLFYAANDDVNSVVAIETLDDLTGYIGGTTNQVTVSDDGDGTVTLATPQDIATTSSPTFADITATGTVEGATLTEGGTAVLNQTESDAAYEAELDDSAGLAAALDDETGTGVAVFGTAPTFTTSVTLTPEADPTTNADGMFAVDTDGWGSGYDAIEFFNGTASAYVVATTASDTPTNGQVPKWNTGGTITWEDDAGAAGGDSVSIDGVAVTDPDFVSTGDIDFVDTSNTITANINSGAVDSDELASTAVTPGSYTLASITVDADGRLTAASSGAGGAGDLLADGSIPLTANWDVGAYYITALRYISDVATGTAPYSCSSTTLNTNLNADLLDGEEASAFQDADADLTTYAGITPSANVQSLLGAADYAAMATLLESAIEGVADLQDLQGAVTDAQVPDDITITGLGTATSITDDLIVMADLDQDSEPSDGDILTYDTTGGNFDWITPNAGTDVTADLEEETHASEHAVGGGDTVFPADPDADRYLMWDDDPGALVWASGAAGGDAWSDAVDSAIIPDTDDTYDLGDATHEFQDAWFDGTLEADAITVGGTAVAVSGGAFHDGFSDFVANEHIDWTSDQGATDIDAGNIPDLSGTYEVQLNNEAGLYAVLSDVTQFYEAGDEDTIAAAISEGALTNSSVVSADIKDGEVAAGDMAATLDLSSKTITLPSRTAGDDRHFAFNIYNPNAAYDVDTQICVCPKLPAAITITNIEVTCDASANDIVLDLKWADAFIGLANAAVIDELDTTSGVASISAGFDDADVASGKCIYVEWQADPSADITQVCIDITYDYD